MILKGINSIGDQTYSNALAENLVRRLDYGFADAGGFFNVNRPTSGLYGGDFSSLRMTLDPNYTSGTVWEGYRKNWVWEPDLTKTGAIQISGVYVNNRLTTSGYSIDYTNGRVIFNSPLSHSSSVKVDYSYKWVSVYNFDDPEFKRIQEESFRVENTLPNGSGSKMSLAQSRVQLPAIGVQVLKESNVTGYELGSNSKKVQKPIIFHVIGERPEAVSQITDILTKQAGFSIHLYNPKAVAQSNKAPLNYNGTLSNPSSTYPNLIKPTGIGGYLWNDGIQNGTVYLYDSNSIMDKQYGTIHASIVRSNSEAIVYS